MEINTALLGYVVNDFSVVEKFHAKYIETRALWVASHVATVINKQPRIIFFGEISTLI
jgi:hypothetical protein